MLFPCSFFLGLASVLAHLRRTSLRVTVDDVLPEPFLKTPNATYARENDNVRDGSFLSRKAAMPDESEQAKNFDLRQSGEAAFYVGGEGHLAKVMKNTGDETGYHVERTWVLPGQYATILWMTRFRTADVTADDDAKKRVAVFTDQGQMLVINPLELQAVEDGEELGIGNEIENVVNLIDGRGWGTIPVGASASEASGYQKLYVAMFGGAPGIVTVEDYRAEGGDATVQQYSLAASEKSEVLRQVDESERMLFGLHLHNAHTFPAHMCGGSDAEEVILVNDLGAIWNNDDHPAQSQTRGSGVLQFFEAGFSSCPGSHGDKCHFRSATDLADVRVLSGGSLMANQMHARQTARDLTARQTLFVAEQPVKNQNIRSRLHWVEVQKDDGSCNLIVKKTVELPLRPSGKPAAKNADPDTGADPGSLDGDGATDVIPLRQKDGWSRVLISDRWADDKNGKVYLYEFQKGGGNYQAREGPQKTWTVGRHPRHTALLYDGETLVSANMKSGSVSVNYIDEGAGAGDETPTEAAYTLDLTVPGGGSSWKPMFVLE